MKQYRKKYTLEDIITNASYIEEEKLELLNKAYNISVKAYKGIVRESKEPLLNHVLSVTYILFRLIQIHYVHLSYTK